MNAPPTLDALLTTLDAAARRRWALCVAIHLVEQLPASLRRAELEQLLASAYPPDLPSRDAPRAAAYQRAVRLVQADTGQRATVVAWTTIAVTLVLGADARGLALAAIHALATNAEIVAGYQADPDGTQAAAHVAAQRAMHRWLIARALDCGPVPALPDTHTGGLI